MRERLQEKQEISGRETVQLFAQALRWVRPLRGRLGAELDVGAFRRDSVTAGRVAGRNIACREHA